MRIANEVLYPIHPKPGFPKSIMWGKFINNRQRYVEGPWRLYGTLFYMMQPERAQNAKQDDWSPRLLRPSFKKLGALPQ